VINNRPQFDRPDGLSPDQRALLKQPLRIPAGYGMRVLPANERAILLAQENLADDPGPRDVLQVWEPPRKGFLYVVSADISSGLELDNSVLDVTRVGTTREPDEQVAQFVTNTIDETDLAYVIDAVGRFYTGRDQQAALVAIECNGMGLSTQNELTKHIGYTNLYIWQYLDATEGHEFTNRYGWYTNQRTRPLILQRYVHAIKTVDPATGYPDYRINSPWTLHEMSDFQSPGPLWLAEAVDGAHDDCIMAGAIGVFVSRSLQYNQRESVHDTRRRVNAEVVRADRIGELRQSAVTFQSTDASADAMMGREFDEYGEPTINPYDDVEHYL
jgi:hypothetical protein